MHVYIFSFNVAEKGGRDMQNEYFLEHVQNDFIKGDQIQASIDINKMYNKMKKNSLNLLRFIQLRVLVFHPKTILLACCLVCMCV